MPTFNQLKESWRVQRGLFGTHGTPREHYNNNGGGMGLYDEHFVDSPIYSDSAVKFTGKSIGEVVFCEETNEKKLITKSGGDK